MNRFRRLLRIVVALMIAGGAVAAAAIDPWAIPAFLLVCVGVTLGRGATQLAAAVLVATFPMLDFTPWAGQGVMRHHDFLLLGVCAGWWLRHSTEAAERCTTYRWRSWPAIYTYWVTASAVMGFVYLARIAEPSAVVHLSPYNALRLAKGTWLAWLVFVSFPRPRLQADRSGDLIAGLARGAAPALIYVGLWCLLERTLLFGWSEWRSDFRVAGPMSGAMNLGGQAFEVCMLICFCLAVYAWRFAGRAERALITGGIALGLAALLLTLTRSALATVAATLVLVAVLVVLQNSPQRRKARWIVSVTFVLAALAIGAFGLPSFRERIEGLPGSWQMRLALYRSAVVANGKEPGVWLIGRGMGTFPGLYRAYQQSVLGNASPAWFAVAAADNESTSDQGALRIQGGTPSYLGTQVDRRLVQATHVRARLRSDQDGQLGIFLCEKNLFTSVDCRAAQLAWQATDPASRGQWQWVEATLQGELRDPLVATESFEIHAPLNLSLGNLSPGRQVQLDRVQLLDSFGTVLWQRDDFSHGPRPWLMTTDRYWPFHVENMALHLAIEQGVIGLLLLCCVVIVALRRLYRRGVAGRAMLAGVVFGPLLAGLVNSPIDTPEFATLWLTPLFAMAAPSASSQRA